MHLEYGTAGFLRDVPHRAGRSGIRYNHQDFVVAPLMLASSLDPVEEVLVVKNARSASVVNALEHIVPQMEHNLPPSK